MITRGKIVMAFFKSLIVQIINQLQSDLKVICQKL